MNRYPEFRSTHDDDDAPWLRELLHDDAAQMPYLDDDGFSARVVQALPPPRRRWLDGLSGVIAVAVIGLGLLFFTGLLQPTLDAVTTTLVERCSAAIAHPSAAAAWALLAPLFALYLAAAALLEE